MNSINVIIKKAFKTKPVLLHWALTSNKSFMNYKY